MSTINDPNNDRNPTTPELDRDDDDNSTESRTTLPPPSRFALRDDGALLVSLEDATDRDIKGREIVAFMVLTSDEAEQARARVEEALSDAAAHTIGRLPKKTQ